VKEQEDKREEYAFPVRTESTMIASTGGMTLRDYFAAKALQGLLSNTNGGYSFEGAAQDAYKYADAMMKTREEGDNEIHRRDS
jgi:hypothetical protein